MKVRNAIRDYQRRLAELDAGYSRARDRLTAAQAKRTKILEEQDQLVAAAQREVDEAVAAMAQEAGPDLTASLLDMELTLVRRLVKESRSGADRTDTVKGADRAPSSGG